ncbi:ABC transporter substrate-binding protein [Paenibacillus sp. PCH8]|uniref:ABC transporter substrate-binding protein n=1 Tax=Paenibacillus sp. PCH8 TaxID=2066524 RepID=UPI000CF8FED7|nr:ABC transporter substrate-binding protein [Paenibacillus sp. PCH8]PQP81587.1 ABC transporter substrate-binding protein [Paenibacillus sp. PCH8]
MKKWLLLLSMMAIIVVLTACSSGGSGKTDKVTSKDGKTVLTLSVTESSPFYQTVEKKFEEKYPDIDLQINAYKTGEQWEPGEYEKYRNSMNTAMLSGKSMDIIEVDDLPLKDYVNKGFLLDMNDLLKKDQTLDNDDLQMNILDGLKLNDGMYTIPLGYMLRLFVGDGEILSNANVKLDDKTWNWKEFEKVSKEVIQKKSDTDQLYALASYPPELLFQEMLVENYAAFVDPSAKKATFDSPEFVNLFEQVKQMYEEKIVTSEEAKPGNQMFNSTSITSPIDFIEGPYMLFDQPELLQTPQAGESGDRKGARVSTMTQFAIHAKSPVTDEAWKFINFLLSEEVQMLQDRKGFSMLKSVNEKKIDELHEKVENGDYKLPNGEMAKVSDEQFTVFKQIVQSADQYVDLDAKVLRIAGEESVAFFGGQKTAEEVAKLIQNRVTTYLNE